MVIQNNNKKNSKNIIYGLKVVILFITIFSIIFEIILFPRMENLFGCIMMAVSCIVFISIFLKSNIIREFPFAFMMFLSMFMYRFLPLIATLLEGIPISYGMQLPIKTFILETILFLVSSIAFYIAITTKKGSNKLQKMFKNIGFYEILDKKMIWSIGIVGFLFRIITFSMGDIAIGNIIGKIFMGFIIFMYIPIILFFPGFINRNYSEKPNFKQIGVWLYLITLIVINLAANSREALIEPIAIIGILYILHVVINDIPIKKVLTPGRVIIIIFILSGSLSLLNIASEAILDVRASRQNLTFIELIKATRDKIVDSNIDKLKEENNQNLNPQLYENGWTEEYLNNFILNRYANMRISDETLYLGEMVRKTQNNKKMINDFTARIVLNLPQPIIASLGINIDKNKYQFSRGDLLYVSSGIGKEYNLGGYRVTSNLGDGIATFGIAYFFIQFIIFLIIFKLLNCYAYKDSDNKVIYSVYGIFSLYTCLNLFRNANGMSGEINFILRGYWQEIVLFMILVSILKFMLKFKIT